MLRKLWKFIEEFYTNVPFIIINVESMTEFVIFILNDFENYDKSETIMSL